MSPMDCARCALPESGVPAVALIPAMAPLQSRAGAMARGGVGNSRRYPAAGGLDRFPGLAAARLHAGMTMVGEIDVLAGNVALGHDSAAGVELAVERNVALEPSSLLARSVSGCGA